MDAITNDFRQLPIVPSWETMMMLYSSSAIPFPQSWELGKELQKTEAVPWKTECECGAGIWSVIRKALLNERTAKAIETRSDMTEGHSPKDDSAVRKDLP